MATTVRKNQWDVVFVVAQGRDGSTVLQHLLNQSDEVLIRGENLIGLQAASMIGTNYLLRHQQSAKERLERGLYTDTSHPWFGFEEIDFSVVQKFATEIILNQVIRPRGVNRVLGFKEIRWFDVPNVFLGMNLLFPAAKYLFLERDAEEMIRGSWWADSTNEGDTLAKRQRLSQLRRLELGEKAKQIPFERLCDPKLRLELEEFLQVNFPKDSWDRVMQKKLIHKRGRPPWEILHARG